MPGSAGDQGPKLGSRGPKLCQNHPEISFIVPQSIPKHIPKRFGGGHFSPQLPKKRLSPQTPPVGYYAPTGLTKLPKPPRDHLVRPQNLRGSLRATKCLDASYSVPRHHTITMEPYLGFPRAPWVRQNPTCKSFTVFPPNMPCKAAKTATGPSCATPKPVGGGPCGQPSAWMRPTVFKTPHNHYGTLPWGPQGTLGPAKSNL